MYVFPQKRLIVVPQVKLQPLKDHTMVESGGMNVAGSGKSGHTSSLCRMYREDESERSESVPYVPVTVSRMCRLRPQKPTFLLLTSFWLSHASG